jgi:hypothetical protein
MEDIKSELLSAASLDDAKTKAKPKPIQSVTGGTTKTPQSHSSTGTIPSDHGSSSTPKTNSNSTSSTPKINSKSTSSTPKTNSKSAYTLDDANEELSQLIISGKITSNDVRCLKATLKEHVSLKEKVEKLKSLLGRSAKAQREAKIDSEAAQKRLVQALREIERLNKKLDKLQTRPTHMDLLMDFETNFDKALLSVGQSGGQETSPSSDAKFGSSMGDVTSLSKEASNLDTMDAMLMQELGEAKIRIEKLETLNSAMMSSSTQLEKGTKVLQSERDDARNMTKRLQMELRMAKLEGDQAQRAMMDKVASLEEMQIEIDLVTKANTKASLRAAKGEEAANSLKTEKHHIQDLESQVQALKEWALASAEAKQLMKERCRILETKLKVQQGRHLQDSSDNSENLLFTKTGSMVIGAGDVRSLVISLGEHASSVDSRFVILRWKFDSSPADLTVGFNVMKGKCKTSSEYAKADYLIKDRVIKGGAGGETEGAFNIDSACTLLWSNAKSWIKPRTVKYAIEIISLK